MKSDDQKCNCFCCGFSAKLIFWPQIYQIYEIGALSGVTGAQKKAARVKQALANRHSVVQEFVLGPWVGVMLSQGQVKLQKKIIESDDPSLRDASQYLYILFIFTFWPF